MGKKYAEISKEELKTIMINSFKDNAIILAKFTGNKEWANDVCKGNLYMNTFKYYRDLEKSTGIKGQGDLKEGVLTVKPESMKLISNQNGNEIIFKPTFMELKYTMDENVLVYCMRAITIKDFEILEFEQNENKVHVYMKLNFSNEYIEKIKSEFGEYVVLLNPRGFIDKVLDITVKNNIPVHFGNVKYRPSNDIDRAKDFVDFSPERFLYKDLDFEYQKEFRIAIYKEKVDDKFLKVGLLDGIAKRYRVEELADYILVTDLELYYL